ncbi:MAG: crossover junction endodeoxyribonuclease RuvC [Sphaerochaeta sp.]
MTLKRKTNKPMIILGIDPGIAQTGWGVVRTNGQQSRPVAFGVIKTATTLTESQRIHRIATMVGGLVAEHKVDACGMEDIFFTKNISSAIPVAKVIGACIHQLASLGIEVHLYSPVTIKTAVTGYGAAQKKQIQEMVRLILGFETIPKPDHAADALATALCHGVHAATNTRIHRV